jgi:hypothetical protein
MEQAIVRGSEMHMKSGHAMRMLLVLALAGGLLSASPTQAASSVLICDGIGQTTLSPGTGDGSQSWAIQIQGKCTGDLQGPYAWLAIAQGGSTGSGLCGPGILVKGLSLSVSSFLVSQGNTTANSKLLTETWSTPGGLPTIYPVVTPYTVSGTASKLYSGKPIGTVLGAGAIFTRLLLRCPGSGGNDGSVHRDVRLIR